MGNIAFWSGGLGTPSTLLFEHDEARAGLIRARLEGGQIAKAAERVAQLCLPHFEYEEKNVFPALALLPYLARGTLRPEMMTVLPLISDFNAKYDELGADHQSILAAIVELLQVAHKQENREFAKLAFSLRAHEWIEDEVIYPAVVLVGKCLWSRFAI